MKFSCEKALLQSAIAVTSRAVAQKSSIPALEGLLLHADSRLTISGYNLQTGIRTKVSTDVTEPGEIVLNARLFGDIIRRMPDDVVVFTADDKQLNQKGHKHQNPPKQQEQEYMPVPGRTGCEKVAADM